MDTKQKLELTIRTATLLKCMGQLVGVEDARLAKMMFAECVDMFADLGKFIDSAQSSQRR